MTHGEESGEALFVLSLPDDVLFLILSYCDLVSLGRLGRTCKRLYRLTRQECVWIWMRKRLTIVGDSRNTLPGHKRRPSDRAVPVREQCRVAVNWKRARCCDVQVIHHRVKQLPWLQLDDRHLWTCYDNLIKCYHQKRDGRLQEVPTKTLHAHSTDVTLFVSKENAIVSGGRDGSICCFDAESGKKVWWQQNCHSSDIHAVDFHQNLIVSGSRDATIKVWSMSEATEDESLQHMISAEGRVWSVAMNPDGSSFTAGTAGLNHVPPLRIWDLQSGQLKGTLGSRYRYGAGVLDIQYESPHILLSCGYDTLIRMWDLRTSWNQCVKKWVEPFDSTIYCVKSDGENAIVTGTARYGMVRLYDKRMTEPVQLYYSGKTSSPVYSLVFNHKHLYLALDKGINLLDFSIR